MTATKRIKYVGPHDAVDVDVEGGGTVARNGTVTLPSAAAEQLLEQGDNWCHLPVRQKPKSKPKSKRRRSRKASEPTAPTASAAPAPSETTPTEETAAPAREPDEV